MLTTSQISATDFQAQALALSQNLSTTLQTSSRTAAESISRFVDGPSDERGGGTARGHNAPHPDPDRQAFWDDFAATADSRARKPAVEPERKDFWDEFAAAGEARAAGKKTVEPERKDFWDEFAAAGTARASTLAQGQVQGQGAKGGKASIGTAAMRKGGGSAGAAGKEDEWSEW